MANTHSVDFELSSSQYAQITDGSQTGLDITGDISLEAWVNVENAPSNESRTICSKWDDSNQASYWFRYNDSSGTKRLQFLTFSSSNIQETYQITQDLGTATWVHVAVTWDASASTAKFYVNGSQTGGDQTGSNTNLKNSTASFIVSGRGDVGASVVQFWDGLIDELRVWNDIRSAGEISSNYQTELTGSEAGLAAYYKFNNNLNDETSNNNNLTGVNSPTFSTDIPSWPSGDTGFIPRIIMF